MTELPATTRSARRFGAFIGLAVGVAGAFGLALWMMLSPTREQLLEQGLKESRRDPAVAERTLGRVLRMSGGRDQNAQIALCRLMVRRQAFVEARELFAKLDLVACRPDLLLALGRDGLKTEFREESWATLEEATRRGSRESVTACELLIADYGEWGQRQKQVAVATRLTELQPDNPRNCVVLVELLTSNGLEAENETAIRAGLRREFPVEVRRTLQHSLVQQLVNQGDAPTARIELAELYRLDGASPRARGLEVYLCRLDGNLDRALEIVNAIVDEAPRLPFPRFTRGVVLLDLRRFAEAASDLEQVIALQPMDAPARFKLSEAYRGLGREELAAENRQAAERIVSRQKQISTLLNSREQDPTNPQTYKDLAAIYEAMGDTQAAANWHKWTARVDRRK